MDGLYQTSVNSNTDEQESRWCSDRFSAG